MFPAFVVITAGVTLLYVVGLAMVQAATSIGRIGLESFALMRTLFVRLMSALGQMQTLETGAQNVRF